MRCSRTIWQSASQMPTCPSNVDSQDCWSCRIQPCMPACWEARQSRTRTRAVSSHISPRLELELKPQWIVLGALSLWMAAVAIELWATGQFTWKLIAAASLLAGVPAILRLTPGLFPRSVRRIIWMADGSWRLCDGYGWEWPAELMTGSRKWGPVTVLAWSAGRQCWRAVLTPGTVGASQYRHFSVRWRLQRHA
jgi:hypothetical protein